MLKEILTARTRPSDKALYNIWARKISDGWTETTITGSLPLTFRAQKAEALTDYTVHGTVAGAGVQTAQLFNKNAKDTSNGYKDRKYLLYTGEVIAGTGNFSISEFITVEPNTQYTVDSGANSSNPSICFYDNNKQYISGIRYANERVMLVATPQDCVYVRMSYYSAAPRYVYLCKGDTALVNIPYGYEIPLTLTAGQHSDDYALYIGDTKLEENEYLDYATQKIYKDVSGTLTPTDPPVAFPAITAYQGENTLSSTETLGSVSVSGKIKEVTP